MASRAVLLVDLENMVGQKAKPGIVAARMRVLIDRAGPGVKVVAACANDRITPAGARVLHEHDVALITVDGSKDAADEALLAEAQRMARDGYRRFAVASNDSRFARLADLGDLEILIWAPQKPRKNYTARASEVHRLAIPAASVISQSTASTRAPVAAPPESGTPTKTHPPITPTNKATTSVNAAEAVMASRQRHQRHQSLREQSGFAVPRARSVTAGVGLLAAGVVFGAGAALGDHAVRRLLCSWKRSH